eukprot:2062738-Rhodomonas_salina.2
MGPPRKTGAEPARCPHRADGLRRREIAPISWGVCCCCMPVYIKSRQSRHTHVPRLSGASVRLLGPNPSRHANAAAHSCLRALIVHAYESDSDAPARCSAASFLAHSGRHHPRVRSYATASMPK